MHRSHPPTTPPPNSSTPLRLPSSPPSNPLQVYVPPHPLVKHWVAIMRNKDTPGPIFRSAAAELGRILLYEAVREWLPTLDAQVETPLGLADVTFIDPTQPIKVVPVLRAGLILLEQSATLLPATETYHVGYVRDDDTLEARCYLNKLPATLSADDRILVSDPMLATGERFGGMREVWWDLELIWCQPCTHGRISWLR